MDFGGVSIAIDVAGDSTVSRRGCIWEGKIVISLECAPIGHAARYHRGYTPSPPYAFMPGTSRVLVGAKSAPLFASCYPH